MLYCGDCLKELEKIDKNSVDLVCLDPPFFTQKNQRLKTRDNSQEYCFKDKWDNIKNYQNYIQQRLMVCHNVLKNTGSIFLHCDRSASHYLRIALDEVFGAKNFVSEIVWTYRRWSNSKKGLLNCHQLIYFYSKTKHFKFNKIYGDYSPTTNLDQIFQERIRDNNGKTVYKTDTNGDAVLIKEKKGVPLSDVWEIPYLNPKAKERVGYPTQKPILLLEKIVQLVTNEGDLVLDPFCGSGTTLVAAKLLNRKHIGIDISEDAINLSKQRLKTPIKTESNLLKKGKDAYINQDEKIMEILNKLEAMPVQRNKGIDGFFKTEETFKPIPIKIQRKNESFEKAKEYLLNACKKNGYQIKILIKTHDKSERQKALFEEAPTEKNILIIDDLNNFIKSDKADVLKKHMDITP